MKSFLILILKALYIALKTIFIFSIFLLPWRIWWDNTKFLTRTYENKNFENKYLNSELKIINWISLFMSGVIFLMYPSGIILIISLFFKGFTLGSIFGKMFFLFMITYFGPMLLELIKEIFSISLLKFFKLESIHEVIQIMNSSKTE